MFLASSTIFVNMSAEIAQTLAPMLKHNSQQTAKYYTSACSCHTSRGEAFAQHSLIDPVTATQRKTADNLSCTRPTFICCTNVVREDWQDCEHCGAHSSLWKSVIPIYMLGFKLVCRAFSKNSAFNALRHMFSFRKCLYCIKSTMSPGASTVSIARVQSDITNSATVLLRMN